MTNRVVLPYSMCLPVAAVAILYLLAPVSLGADDLDTLEQQAFSAAVDRVAESVVRIETVGGLEKVGRVLFGTGPTTGLVVDKDGYIISSAFNFINQPSSILVRLPDGQRKPAQLVATDHNRMVVLLKIEVDKPLRVPEIVPENDMRVGQWAIGVGRTFEGDRPNASVGVLSAVNRIWGKAIQTDAAVSPSNYGGPLLDIRGRVLGVLVPLSPKAAKEIAGVEWYDSGIGFAIPAEHVLKVLPRLKKGEDLYPGVIGITFRDRNLYTGKPVIAACRPKSPAREAGLKTGDEIVEVDGMKTPRAAQVKQQISRRYAGEKIRMAVLRDKKRVEVELELVAKLEPYEHPFLGILPIRSMREDDDDEKAKKKPTGVKVRYVYPKSPAEKSGIKPGDVLVSFAGKPVKGEGTLRRRITDNLPGDEVPLEIRRGSENIKLKAQLAPLPEDLPPKELPPARAKVEPGEGEGPQSGAVSLKVPEMKNDAWAYVPEKYNPAVPHGVVIWLHGPDKFDEKAIIAQWKPLCDRHDLILLAPKSADPKKWSPEELTLVRKLLHKITSNYTVDAARVVVHGHASGGRMAYQVAFRDRAHIRGVAVVDANVTGRPPKNDPLHRLAFYVATAKKSPSAAGVARAATQLREMKHPVTLKDLGEEPRYLNADELAELARWIDTLDRI